MNVLSKYIFLSLSLSVFLSRCECEDDLDALPKKTQTGEGTFGCLVNGKVWRPYGSVGYSNLFARYDPDYAGGTLDISAYQSNKDHYSDIYMYTSNMKSVGVYDLSELDTGSVFFYFSPACYFDRDESIYREGTLTITRFDLSEQIVSGTFEFTLSMSGCDTVRITDGRFDLTF